MNFLTACVGLTFIMLSAAYSVFCTNHTQRSYYTVNSTTASHWGHLFWIYLCNCIHFTHQTDSTNVVVILPVFVHVGVFWFTCARLSWLFADFQAHVKSSHCLYRVSLLSKFIGYSRSVAVLNITVSNFCRNL